MLILAESKIADVLKEHPELKEVLLGLSPKFHKLDNKAVFATVGRIARMKDVARVGGMSICELLYPLNDALGQADEMSKAFPGCLQEINLDLPEPVAKTPRAIAEGYPILDPPGTEPPPWYTKTADFIVLDLLGMNEDPFRMLMTRARQITPGDGFGIIQMFRPDPLIDILEGMGFESASEQIDPIHWRIWFHRKDDSEQVSAEKTDQRVGVVLQSATPVVWPVLKRMMQSERLNERVRFDEIKVWEKTEKHLAWMVQEKADISFSAVVAATRLFAGGLDVRMASVDVWDNFYLLSRGTPVETLEDLKGRTLFMPLIKNAPPYAVTSYLLKAHGVDPAALDIQFGKPFGRMDELMERFGTGEYDTVLLREPEASFALKAAGDAAFEPLSFRKLWSDLHGEKMPLPNAGLVFKGSFLREHPEEARIIVEELKDAIRWVNENPREAAAQVTDEMGQSADAVEMFLSRVKFDHVPADEARESVRHYLEVLMQEGGMEMRGSDLDAAMAFFDLFE